MAFQQVAGLIAGVAHNLGYMDKGKLIIHVIKPDPNSNFVRTGIEKVTAEQFAKGGV